MARSLVPAAMLSAVVLSGCGSSSNVNQIWGLGAEDDGADTLLMTAQAAYDAGDFEAAEKATETLLERNPDNEDAAVLLGYVSLSRGGVDPYSLARALNNLESSKTSAATAKLADETEKKSTDASSTLQSLATLINLSETDIASLTEKQFDNNGVEPVLYKTSGDDANPINVPAKITDEIRANVEVLARMNKAIKAICRFVSDDVKTEDARHKDAACTATTAPRNNAAKAHFLWAFSHLTEALVYQTVLMYQAAGQTETNFQKGANQVKNVEVDTSNIDEFVGKISELNNAVDAVFDTTSENSQLRLTLLGLTAVNLAFDQIVGLPDNIKKRITNVLAKINTLGESFGGGTANNTKALKGQLTEKFTKTLGTKIDQAVTKQLEGTSITTYEQLETAKNQDPTLVASFDKVVKMCSSYDSLTGSLDPAKKEGSRPATCPPAP